MTTRRLAALVSLALAAALALALGACHRRAANSAFVMVLEANPDPRALNPLIAGDAASERYRQLMFNSLMKKNERFDYVPELASAAQVSSDGLAVTVTLRDGVKFHNGKPLTSADVKYTFDKLLASGSPKSASFYETVAPAAAQSADASKPAQPSSAPARQPFITSIDAPDPRTVVFHLRRPWLELFANFIPIGIIPEGTYETQEQSPVGTGPYKFVSRNTAQQFADFAAFDDYWEGAPQVKNLRVRVILDAGTQQAGLLSGEVDLAVNTALTPDTYTNLGKSPNLQLVQSPGANVQYIAFNTQHAPLSDARVRQAIAYAVNREDIIKNLLQDQARVAHSIVPPESWAYSEGKTYSYDQAQAKKLLDDAGLKDPDGDGVRKRFAKPLAFKISATNAVGRQTAGIIQNALAEVGVPVDIQTLEDNTMRDQVQKGDFDMTMGRWVGGNQDPIFLRDLFTYLQGKENRFNRSRYSNPELDKVLAAATSTADRNKARELYVQAQQIISADVPMLPLWYWNNIVVAKKSVSGISVPPSGDWTFVRSLSVAK